MLDLTRRGAVLGLGAVAMLPAANAAAQETPRRGGTMTIGLTSNNSKTFDVRYTVQLDELPIDFLIYDALTYLDHDFSIKPCLAKSWTIDPGGQRYTFQLRNDVTFHDGTRFDAQAAKWNIDQRLDEKAGSPLRFQFGPLIESVEAPSPTVLVINMKYPYPALLAELTGRLGWMMSPAGAARYGEDYGRNPVGTGPYVFKEWITGTRITLERYKEYWAADTVFLDSIVFQSVPNNLLGLQRLRIGEVDFIGQLSPTDIRQIDPRGGIVSSKAPYGRWYALQWQVDTPPFDNLVLRRAVATAIDRPRINEVTLQGQGTISNGILPLGTLWSSKSQPETFRYDPQQARALLKESGWPADATMTLNAQSDSIYDRFVQLAAEQLRAVGIKLEIARVPLSEAYAKTVRRELNFIPTSWVPRADPDLVLYYILHSKGAGNSTGYNDAETDRLLTEARIATDVDTRLDLYTKVEQRMMQQLPYIPLFYGVEYSAMGPKVRGYVPWADLLLRVRYMWKAA